MFTCRVARNSVWSLISYSSIDLKVGSHKELHAYTPFNPLNVIDFVCQLGLKWLHSVHVCVCVAASKFPMYADYDVDHDPTDKPNQTDPRRHC